MTSILTFEGKAHNQVEPNEQMDALHCKYKMQSMFQGAMISLEPKETPKPLDVITSLNKFSFKL